MTKKEQITDTEKYFGRRLTVDELFILEVTNARYKTKLKKLIKFMEESGDTPEEIGKAYEELTQLII